MGEGCTVERRLTAGRAYYLATCGDRVVARSPGFDARDAQADAHAAGQLGRVLEALGWRPVGDAGRLYERG